MKKIEIKVGLRWIEIEDFEISCIDEEIYDVEKDVDDIRLIGGKYKQKTEEIELLRMNMEAYKLEYESEKDKREKAEVENATLRKLLVDSKSEIREELEWLRDTVRLAVSDNI